MRCLTTEKTQLPMNLALHATASLQPCYIKGSNVEMT
jgi:hypothetical protein